MEYLPPTRLAIALTACCSSMHCLFFTYPSDSCLSFNPVTNLINTLLLKAEPIKQKLEAIRKHKDFTCDIEITHTVGQAWNVSCKPWQSFVALISISEQAFPTNCKYSAVASFSRHKRDRIFLYLLAMEDKQTRQNDNRGASQCLHIRQLIKKHPPKQNSP